MGVWRHSKARVRGMKRVQVEPHLSITGACSAQWVPIRPKTDAAFLYALIHVMLHEAPRAQLDLPHLAQRTSSPYLVGPHGYSLRERATRKPLVWDEAAGRATPHDAHGIREALSASVQVDARLPVIPVRALKNKGTEEFTAKQREVAQLLDDGKIEMGEAQLLIEHYWAGALRRAVIDGDIENGSLMAGARVASTARK